MTKEISLEEALNLLAPGMRVYVPGSTAEPTALMDALIANPDAAEGLTFFGAYVPGLNRTDLSALTASTRVETYFMTPALRSSFDAGKVDFFPLQYSQIFDRIQNGPQADVAFLHLSPPDENGMCSFGITADFSPAVAERAKVTIGLINQAMPHIPKSPKIAQKRLSFSVEASAPLLTFSTGDPPEALRKVAGFVAQIIEDGDTLQFGIGKGPEAVLQALTAHKDLQIFSGMIGESTLDLIASGALRDAPGAIQTGMIIGSTKLYDTIVKDHRLEILPADVTHSAFYLNKIDRLTCINSGIEIDLLGQLNSEMIAGKQISGPGGLPDFTAAANLTPGAKSIVALQSVTGDGTKSRIVPNLAGETVVSVSRNNLEYIVTEHGIANLKSKSIDDRATELIRVADPKFRKQLSEAWEVRRKNI